MTNQLTPDTGAPGEGMVQLLSSVAGDNFRYPSPDAILKVTISVE